MFTTSLLASTSGGLIPGWAIALVVIVGTLPVLLMAVDSIMRWRRSS